MAWWDVYGPCGLSFVCRVGQCQKGVWKFLYDGITLLDVVAFPLYHGCWMVKMLSILVSCIFALFLWRTNGFGYTLSVNNVVG